MPLSRERSGTGQCGIDGNKGITETRRSDVEQLSYEGRDGGFVLVALPEPGQMHLEVRQEQSSLIDATKTLRRAGARAGAEGELDGEVDSEAENGERESVGESKCSHGRRLEVRW